MIKRYLTFIFIFCFLSFCHGQDSANRKWFISLSPAILNVPSSEIGIQLGVHNRTGYWGFGTEIAFPFEKSHSRLQFHEIYQMEC